MGFHGTLSDLYSHNNQLSAYPIYINCYYAINYGMCSLEPKQQDYFNNRMRRKLQPKGTENSALPHFVALFLTISIISACSKSGAPKPVAPPKATTALLLMQGGEWVTTAATFYAGKNAQGAATVAPDNYLGDYGAFALAGMTFFSADSVRVQDYGNVAWSLSGSNPTHLEVNFGKDQAEGASVVDGQIVSLDSTRLVMIINSTYFPAYGSYKQTLTAHGK